MPGPLAVEMRRMARWRILASGSFLAMASSLSAALRSFARDSPAMTSSLTASSLELSYSEISEAIGVPEKTVKSRLFEARHRLGELLRLQPGGYDELSR